MSSRRSGSSQSVGSVRELWGARLALLSALCVGTPGCMNPADRASAFFFPATANTYERAGEEVTLTATYGDQVGEKGVIKYEPGLGAHAGPSLAMAAAFLAERVAAFLETESERYSATYSAMLVGDEFYASTRSTKVVDATPTTSTKVVDATPTTSTTVVDASSTTPTTPTDGTQEKKETAASKVRLKALTLMRQVDGSDGKPTEAMKLQFAVEGSRDGTAFTVKPTSVKVTKAKAKLAAFALFDVPSWFAPPDEDLDLKVQVDIHAAWIDRLGNPRYERIVSQEFKVSNLKLGTEKTLQIPMVLSPGIPRTYLGTRTVTEKVDGKEKEAVEDVLGLGNFAVTILVKEYDDYGKRVAEVAEEVGKRADALDD